MATRTATQRREQAKIAYNAFMDTCPTRQLLSTLSDKWVCLVLTALATGPKRYSELGRIIAGVSQKMLTQTLRTLRRDGLIGREVTPSVPVRVDYRLTELGRDLAPVISAIKTWGRATHGRRRVGPSGIRLRRRRRIDRSGGRGILPGSRHRQQRYAARSFDRSTVCRGPGSVAGRNGRRCDSRPRPRGPVKMAFAKAGGGEVRRRCGWHGPQAGMMGSTRITGETWTRN